jgi:hypothetical protein
MLQCGTAPTPDNLQISKTGTVSNTEQEVINTFPQLQSIFPLQDAEKILGEPAHLTDSSATVSKNNSIYRCTYFANVKDEKSGKTGCIYFLLEHYSDIADAQKKYTDIKVANQNHEGVKELQDLGDEAYFHTDNQNFYFIMVRKGAKVFNMKVNKITSKTSLAEFNLTANKITERL